MECIKPGSKKSIKIRRRSFFNYYLIRIGALGFLLRRQIFPTSGRWIEKPKKERRRRTSGRRSSTPRRFLMPLPESFTTLRKWNYKGGTRINGVVIIPDGGLTITLEKLSSGVLVVLVDSALQGGELGGHFFKGITHGAQQRTHIEEGLGYGKLRKFCGNWPITDKEKQSLVNIHVQGRKLSEGGSRWIIKTTKKKQIHKVNYVKLSFYL